MTLREKALVAVIHPRKTIALTAHIPQKILFIENNLCPSGLCRPGRCKPWRKKLRQQLYDSFANRVNIYHLLFTQLRGNSARKGGAVDGPGDLPPSRASISSCATSGSSRLIQGPCSTART